MQLLNADEFYEIKQFVQKNKIWVIKNQFNWTFQCWSSNCVPATDHSES